MVNRMCVSIRRRRLTDRASAATDSADCQRYATWARRQDATESRNARLSVVSCKPLLSGGREAPAATRRPLRAPVGRPRVRGAPPRAPCLRLRAALALRRPVRIDLGRTLRRRARRRPARVRTLHEGRRGSHEARSRSSVDTCMKGSLVPTA